MNLRQINPEGIKRLAGGEIWILLSEIDEIEHLYEEKRTPTWHQLGCPPHFRHYLRQMLIAQKLDVSPKTPFRGAQKQIARKLLLKKRVAEAEVLGVEPFQIVHSSDYCEGDDKTYIVLSRPPEVYSLRKADEPNGTLSTSINWERQSYFIYEISNPL